MTTIKTMNDFTSEWLAENLMKCKIKHRILLVYLIQYPRYL